jgi:hypothetical protein
MRKRRGDSGRAIGESVLAEKARNSGAHCQRREAGQLCGAQKCQQLPVAPLAQLEKTE